MRCFFLQDILLKHWLAVASLTPSSRYQPYLVGLGLGYLLYTMKNQPKLKLNPIALTWIWAVAFAVGMSTCGQAHKISALGFGVLGTKVKTKYKPAKTVSMSPRCSTNGCRHSCGVRPRVLPTLCSRESSKSGPLGIHCREGYLRWSPQV